ncbi:MAG TPA: hypothetical protein VN494_06875 [Patescibacteria group bacterium]|nr:hypothetical protein [Patescibacteria group bacterium]
MRTFLVLTLLTLLVVSAGCATTGTTTGSREPGGYPSRPSSYPGGSGGY